MKKLKHLCVLLLTIFFTYQANSQIKKGDYFYDPSFTTYTSFGDFDFTYLWTSTNYLKALSPHFMVGGRLGAWAVFDGADRSFYYFIEPEVRYYPLANKKGLPFIGGSTFFSEQQLANILGFVGFDYFLSDGIALESTLGYNFYDDPPFNRSYLYFSTALQFLLSKEGKNDFDFSSENVFKKGNLQIALPLYYRRIDQNDFSFSLPLSARYHLNDRLNIEGEIGFSRGGSDNSEFNDYDIDFSLGVGYNIPLMDQFFLTPFIGYRFNQYGEGIPLEASAKGSALPLYLRADYFIKRARTYLGFHYERISYELYNSSFYKQFETTLAIKGGVDYFIRKNIFFNFELVYNPGDKTVYQDRFNQNIEISSPGELQFEIGLGAIIQR